MQSGRLQFISPPPFFHHDLLHAAVRVGHIEVRTGYNFKNKLLCIEALKRTGKASPLFYRGASVVLDRNNRLALLGDRVLSLALCEIWFHSGHSTGNYNIMNKFTETRAALNITGRAMKLHQDILLHSSTPESSNDQVAETFEAIIGAIYVDSDHSVLTVKEVLNNLGLDNHEFLQTVDSQVALARSEKELNEDTVREKSYTRNPQSNHAALRPSKGKPETAMEHYESRAEESHEPSIGFSHTAEVLKNEPITNIEGQVAGGQPSGSEGKQSSPQYSWDKRLRSLFGNHENPTERPLVPLNQSADSVLREETSSQLQSGSDKETPRKPAPKGYGPQLTIDQQRQEAEKSFQTVWPEMPRRKKREAWCAALKEKRLSLRKSQHADLVVLYYSQLCIYHDKIVKKEAKKTARKKELQRKTVAEEGSQVARDLKSQEQSDASDVCQPRREEDLERAAVKSRDEVWQSDHISNIAKASPADSRSHDTPEAAAQIEGQEVTTHTRSCGPNGQGIMHSSPESAKSEDEKWPYFTPFTLQKYKFKKASAQASNIAKFEQSARQPSSENQGNQDDRNTNKERLDHDSQHMDDIPEPEDLNETNIKVPKSRVQPEPSETGNRIECTTLGTGGEFYESQMDLFMADMKENDQAQSDATQEGRNILTTQDPKTTTNNSIAETTAEVTKPNVGLELNGTRPIEAMNQVPAKNAQPSTTGKETKGSKRNSFSSISQPEHVDFNAEDDNSTPSIETIKAAAGSAQPSGTEEQNQQQQETEDESRHRMLDSSGKVEEDAWSPSPSSNPNLDTPGANEVTQPLTLNFPSDIATITSSSTASSALYVAPTFPPASTLYVPPSFTPTPTSNLYVPPTFTKTLTPPPPPPPPPQPSVTPRSTRSKSPELSHRAMSKRKHAPHHASLNTTKPSIPAARPTKKKMPPTEQTIQDEDIDRNGSGERNTSEENPVPEEKETPVRKMLSVRNKRHPLEGPGRLK
ncbi:hypothetical protein J1614_009305 [Plenodomus biglobosus]|nr:hypothetical protein J1614_009305 [Plenodomus biglobosus]